MANANPQDRESPGWKLPERIEPGHLMSFALNRAREAAYLIDGNSRFVYVNDESCRALQYSVAELLQMTVIDIDPDWSAEKLVLAWQVLREKGSLVVETTHCRKDGTLVPVEVNPATSSTGARNTAWRSRATSRSASVPSSRCARVSSATGKSSTMFRMCSICSKRRRKGAFACSRSTRLANRHSVFRARN